MPYRLLALDLDGTTVNNGQLPTPRVRAAVAAATAAGVHVIVATGRPYVSARRYGEALDLCTPLICFQGALIKECGGAARTLFAEAVPPAPFAEVIELARARGLELNIYTEETIFHGPTTHSPEFYDLWFGLAAQPVEDLAAAFADLQRVGRPVLKGLFISAETESVRLTAELQARVGDRLTVMRSHPLFVEVTSPNVSKGKALAFLADWYGIPRSETIAVGDSGNDLSMVEWAGVGVAVANATPEVLAAADWIAPPVTEDGVAAVIEKFILAC
ncbi:MAG: Cof-type HAD-IIB family hydrolase [Anaerolineae bacterium]|nr:Cof-type HAD-IIB family hydrolase [Anaerolineae bacterium]